MKLRPFELALVVIFGGLAILAMVLLSVLDFSRPDPQSNASYVGPVQLWGTLPASQVQEVLRSLKERDERFNEVTYKFISDATFDTELTNALADGVGPDLLLVSHEHLVDQRRRIQPISYEVVPRRDVTNLYIDGAAIFGLSDGLYAYPLMVDPLMMYWNKDILANQGFLAAPKTWEELVSVQFPRLIDRGFDRAVRRSVVAMGVYPNVRNAFGTVSMLLIQAGSERVLEADGGYSVRLDTVPGQVGQPFRNSLEFFLRFGQPSNTLYSWNRSFIDDRSQFISGDLVFYFGYGSEGREIERLNPNLSFDIAEVPQGASATVRRTYGKFYGVSLLRSTDNVTGAYNVMGALASVQLSTALASSLNMVPTLREAITAGSNDSFGRFTYLSAPITYGWLNPDINATNSIFADAVRNVSENRSDLPNAVNDTLTRLRSEY